MKNYLDYFVALIVLASLLFVAETALAKSNYGDNVNALCAPQQPYTGSCSLCHISPYSASTPAKKAYLAGGSTLINFFCPAPPVPVCTDADGDTFSVEGGDCGFVDCNDNLATVHPGAAEICGDGIGQDCNGKDLSCPPPVLSPLLFLLGNGK